MSIHMQNKDQRSDDKFVKGDISYLVENNKCRLLDGRRTPGTIKSVDIDKAMFTFLIGDYEDKGKTWTLYANNIQSFQFEQNSLILPKDSLKILKENIKTYHKKLTIKPNKKDKQDTLVKISEHQKEIEAYFKKMNFFPPFLEQSSKLQEITISYMKKHHLDLIESQISKQMVINPNSGELAKAIAIMLAKIGLKPYKGTILRTTPFDQNMLKSYLITRLALMKVLFQKPLTIYRGMSSEIDFKKIDRTFLSYTDSLEVAKAFTEFEDQKYKSVYLIKKEALPHELFMTHYETKAFHETYDEKEVITIHYKNIII